MKTRNNMKKYIGAILLGAVLFTTQSCSEQVDDSARFVNKETTIASYLEQHDVYSEYVKLMRLVLTNPLDTTDGSKIYQLMQARGNYTVFAPTNEAVKCYLREFMRDYNKRKEGRGEPIIPEDAIDTVTTYEGAVLTINKKEVSDSIPKVIVYNSIINGYDETDPYQTSYFEDNIELAMANMNDRKLTPTRNGNSWVINGRSNIHPSNCNIYAINGYIHQVDTVVAPSDETVAEKLQQMITDGGNYVVMAKMLGACGYYDESNKYYLGKYEDRNYYKAYHDQSVSGLKNVGPRLDGKSGTLPERRYYGYTIFAEPDDFWAGYGIDPETVTPEQIQQWVIEKELALTVDGRLYGKDNNDYKSPDNILNQFISYHVLPEKLANNKLVIHFNENGYTPEGKSKLAAVYDYYTSTGMRRLLKTFESVEAGGIYLNRFAKLDNGRDASATGGEKDMDLTDNTMLNPLQSKGGVKVLTNERTEIVNGFIYPIEGVLAFSNGVQENMGKERIRIDATAMFKELITNDIRANESSDLKYSYKGMPCSNVFSYLEDCYINEGSNFYYLTGRGFNWRDYQGDEINITGQYEITFRLPPVPSSTTWELRFGLQTPASPQRGMCQIYWGSSEKEYDNSSPTNNMSTIPLPAAGIPLDMRMGGKTRYAGYRDLNSSGSIVNHTITLPSIMGWLEDTGDDEADIETEKIMRNNGYMKGPRGFHVPNNNAEIGRKDPNVNRRIVLTSDMDFDKTYYMRLKSVLDDVHCELFFDYIEFCPSNVYNHPTEGEDIW